MSISEIVKNKNLIGANAPNYKISIKGAAGSVGEFTGRVFQGPGSNLGTAMSKWISTNDGRFMAVFLNGNKQLVTGYCDDISFLYQSYAMDPNNLVVQSEITTIQRYYNQLDVCKLDNGEALLVINDRDEASGNCHSLTSVYKSVSGNGGDWAHVSTIYESSIRSQSFGLYTGECHLDAINNRVFATFEAYEPYDSTYLRARNFLYYSDDGGTSWIQGFKDGYGIVWPARGISQASPMPDGSIWICSMSVESNHLYKSTNNGESFSYVVDLEGTTAFRNTIYTGIYNVNFFFDPISRGVFAWSPSLDVEIWVRYSPSGDYLYNFNESWGEKVIELGLNVDYGMGRTYKIDERLIFQFEDANRTAILSVVTNRPEIQVKELSVSQSLGQAGVAAVSLDNTEGKYSYDSSINNHLVGPNTEVSIELGYGDYLEKVFLGLIDKSVLSTFPQSLSFDARDYSKLALDGVIVRPTDGFRTVTFENESPEDIFFTLATWAGYASIHVDTTGLIVTSKTFNWETYGDAFGWLCDVVSFDWWVDTEGAIYYKQRASNEPRVSSEPHTLVDDGSGVLTATLEHRPVFALSEVVTDSMSTVVYVRDTDYSIDLASGVIEALPGGALQLGGDVLVDYTYPRHIFREGEDIISLTYTIDDADLYYKVVAFGVDSSGIGISAEWSMTSQSFGIATNKILKVDVEGTTTTDQLLTIATNIGQSLQFKARSVSVEAIAVPTVKVGDCVQIIESSSTISEIYRVTDLTYQFDVKLTMSFTAYYVGYAPGGE